MKITKAALLKHAAYRLAERRDYFTYNLIKYCEVHATDPAGVKELLGLKSDEDYYLLCLCKVPAASDDTELMFRLMEIAKLLQCNANKLFTLVKEFTAYEQ